MGGPLEIFLTVVVLSFWFLFPIGIFLSVGHVDKNTDQIIRLDQLRHGPAEKASPSKKKMADVSVKKDQGGRKNHGEIHFRGWLRH